MANANDFTTVIINVNIKYALIPDLSENDTLNFLNKNLYF